MQGPHALIKNVQFEDRSTNQKATSPTTQREDRLMESQKKLVVEDRGGRYNIREKNSAQS
jgi:hypothetical protein